MEREELLKSITEIGTCEDEAQRRTLLTNLTENVGKVFDEVDTLKTDAESMQTKLDEANAKVESTKEENKKLFLKLSDQMSEADGMSGETGIKKEEKKEYKSYKELGKSYL